MFCGCGVACVWFGVGEWFVGAERRASRVCLATVFGLLGAGTTRKSSVWCCMLLADV